MDLFIMKRYVEDNKNSKLSTQEDHLSSLLSKIEKRKKQREDVSRSQRENAAAVAENEKPDVECTATNVIDEKKKSKKRKHVVEESTENEILTCEKSECVEDLAQKKKKKKRKKIEELCDTLKLNDTDILGGLDNSSNNEKFETSGFTVIGTEKFSKKAKVKRVLPYWLAKPVVISGSMKKFTKTIHDIPNLDIELIKLLKENNIEHFFPVQSAVIPWLLESHRKPMQYRPQDVCISAPTGSGKTLAFVLPVIQALMSRVMRHIRALVVLPVQELAVQIYEVFKEYCKGTDLKVILLTGQRSFISEQQELVKTSAIIGQYNAVDIVVATPGRLVDHIIGTPGFSLKYLRFLVIDEADRIIDSIQNDWLYHIEKHIHGEKSGKHTALSCSALETVIPPPPQKLLFSATLTQDPEKLEQIGLFQPKLFTTIVGENNPDVHNMDVEVRGDFVGKYTTPAELSEKCCVVNSEYKPLVLFHLMNTENWKNVLCFTSSQENTHRLALLLKHMGRGTLKVGEISAAHRRHDRDRILRKFSSGKLKVLISSDALARGIDVPGVDCVLSYDVPTFVKTHIHRIGRTGRAGKKGTAVTFLVNKEVKKFKDMLQTAGKKEGIEEFSVSESDLEYLEDDFRNALESLREDLNREKLRESKKVTFLKRFQHKSVIFQKTKRRNKVSKINS